jgi:peptide/nickel transport system substrate-binding protein
VDSYDDAVRSRLILPVLLALVLVAGACGGKDDDSDGGPGASGPDATGPEGNVAVTSPAGDPQPGGVLRYGLGAETNGWDPTRDRWATAGSQVARAFYEPLATYGADYEVVPYLAESIEPNDDYTVWTITPREGITFHDGAAFDAEAIKANLDAHKDSPLTSSAIALVQEVVVTPDDTVEVRMSAPWAHFPHILTGQGGYVAAPTTLGNGDASLEPIGTGPFVFTDWVPDDHLTVERYEDYWQAGLPLLDGIEFIPLTDNDTRLATFDSGDLDILATAVPHQIIDLQDQAEAGEVQLFLDRTSETLENFTLLNPDEPPFDDIRARQAIAYATDKQGLIDTIHDGLFEPANGIFHQSSGWYTDVAFPQFDPDRARELVEEYEADVGPFEFQFSGTNSVEDTEIRQALAAQWEQVGISAQLDNLDSTASIVQVLGGDYQASNFALFTAQHPDSDWQFMHGSTKPPAGQLGLNIIRIDSPELDEALDTARASAEPDVVREAYAEVNRILAEEIPMVFLWHSLTGLVAQNSVHGITDNPLPDGGEGLGLFGVQHSLAHIWLEQ